jgi:hypothetical protein
MIEKQPGFEKLTDSDSPMYGPRGLLLCGFAVPAQPKFAVVLRHAGLQDLPLIWAGAAEALQTIATLLDLPAGSGAGCESALPRAVIASGLTAIELRRLMDACRLSGMQPALWAALTPISESWALGQLLTELAAERDALLQRQQSAAASRRD